MKARLSVLFRPGKTLFRTHCGKWFDVPGIDFCGWQSCTRRRFHRGECASP